MDVAGVPKLSAAIEDVEKEFTSEAVVRLSSAIAVAVGGSIAAVAGVKLSVAVAGVKLSVAVAAVKLLVAGSVVPKLLFLIVEYVLSENRRVFFHLILTGLRIRGGLTSDHFSKIRSVSEQNIRIHDLGFNLLSLTK